MTVKENVDEVKKEIEIVLQETNRKIEEITIIAVTKTADLIEAENVVEAGIFNIGENRIQEAQRKCSYLSPKFNDIIWHLVGHLQTNKVKKAVKIFDLIHSLDSIRLTEEIDKEAKILNKIQNVLVEVKISDEETKFGVKAEEVLGFLREIETFNNIRVLGLMGIAPYTANREIVRSSFRKCRILFEEARHLKYRNSEMKYLSCGMTDDYKDALLEGANMLRIGRAFFKK